MIAFVLSSLVGASAYAIDESDLGIYVVVHRDGSLTTKSFRLAKGDKSWKVEDRRPDGSWVDVTCTGDCVLGVSGLDDIKRFFPGTALDEIVPTCVHNVAFAFCRYSLVKDAKFRGYIFVALTEQKPISLRLARVVPKR
jgi:hypothetical protein